LIPAASASDLFCRTLRRILPQGTTAASRYRVVHSTAAWPAPEPAKLVLLTAAWRIANIGRSSPGLASAADRRKEIAAFSPLMLRAAVAAGEASTTDLAYLEDRVRMHAGQPQLYGTQFIHKQQSLRSWTIEDPENLDRRRASAGPGPFADYEALMRSLEG
jgi:hypothetical protein